MQEQLLVDQMIMSEELLFVLTALIEDDKGGPHSAV